MLIFHDESNLLLCVLGPRLCGTRCPSRTPTWLLRWELVIQLIKQKCIYLQLVEMSFYTPTPQWCGCVRPRVCLAQSDIIVNCSDRLQPWLGVGRGVTELAWFKKKKKSVCVCWLLPLCGAVTVTTQTVFISLLCCSSCQFTTLQRRRRRTPTCTQTTFRNSWPGEAHIFPHFMTRQPNSLAAAAD